jgi:hypothetical protein
MKKFDLIFEERSGYLYACVTAGSIDRAAALEYLAEVAERVKSSGADRLMLERDIPVMLTPTDLFFTAQDFLDMIGRTRVAFVNRHASIHDEMQFAMMIGTNRGANYRLFRNVDEAEEWLRGL